MVAIELAALVAEYRQHTLGSHALRAAAPMKEARRRSSARLVSRLRAPEAAAEEFYTTVAGKRPTPPSPSPSE